MSLTLVAVRAVYFFVVLRRDGQIETALGIAIFIIVAALGAVPPADGAQN